jgi:hypothetical protein
MTPQHIGPEHKPQLEQQLEKVTRAIELKNIQIDQKKQRASLYRRLCNWLDINDEVEADAVWLEIYAIESASSLNDAEMLKLDLGDLEAMRDQLATVVSGLSSGLVVATAGVPRNLRRKV